MAGFVKLYRDLQDHWVNKNSQALHLWVNILLEATHTEHRTMRGSELITLKPGQLPFGARWFEEKTGIPKSTIARYMKLFEGDGMIAYERSGGQVFSLVTVCNWDVWQGRDGTGTPQRQRQPASQGNGKPDVGRNWDGTGTELGRTQEGKEGKEGFVVGSDLVEELNQLLFPHTRRRLVSEDLQLLTDWLNSYGLDLVLEALNIGINEFKPRDRGDKIRKMDYFRQYIDRLARAREEAQANVRRAGAEVAATRAGVGERDLGDGWGDNVIRQLPGTVGGGTGGRD